MAFRRITSADQQRAEAQKLLDSIYKQASSNEDPALFIASLVNNPTERYLNALRTEDPAMLAAKDQARRLALKQDPVLITGPSGTGKELLARALHGPRHESSFHHVNCAGMPEGLIESELFGHTSGAFTGATRDYRGILRTANNGTVFLDEIGEAPMHLQAKLLTALQPTADGEFRIRPVGSTTYESVKFRLVAATKVDLFAAVQRGTFREDLYGRLMAHEIVTTPLSQRPADIILILHYLGLTELTSEDHDALASDYWQPRLNLFNVRALQAYVARKRA